MRMFWLDPSPQQRRYRHLRPFRGDRRPSHRADHRPLAQRHFPNQAPIPFGRPVRRQHKGDCDCQAPERHHLDLHPGEFLGVAGLQGMNRHRTLSGLLFRQPPSQPQQGLMARPSRLPRQERRDQGEPRCQPCAGGAGQKPCSAATRRPQQSFPCESSSALCAVGALTVSAPRPTGSPRRPRTRAGRPTSALHARQRPSMLAATSRKSPSPNGCSRKKSRVATIFDPTPRRRRPEDKRQIYLLMNDYIQASSAVAYLLTEIEELVNLCHRARHVWRPHRART